MAGAATVSLIMLLILGLVLVGFVVGIVLWVTGGRSRAGGGGGEMACGRCGYSVRGLEQLHCPECGADLREVGIQGGASGGRRVTGIVLTSVCGLVLLSCFGLGAVGYLFAAPRVSQPSTTTIQLKQAAPVTPTLNDTAEPPAVDEPGDEEVDDPAGE